MSHIYQSDRADEVIDNFEDAYQALAAEVQNMSTEDKAQLKARIVDPVCSALSSLLS